MLGQKIKKIKHRQRMNRIFKQLVAKGRCTQCYKPKGPSNSKYMCENCLEKRRTQCRERARQKYGHKPRPLIEYKKMFYTKASLARKLGVKTWILISRLKDGINIEKIAKTPVRKYQRNQHDTRLS